MQKGKINKPPPNLTEHAKIKFAIEARENKSPDMKTIFVADLLIWGKDRKQTQEKLNQFNLIIKKYGLKMDKMMTMRM
jgi:hypothetical protein